MKKNLRFAALLVSLMVFPQLLKGQTHVNLEWVKLSGVMPVLEWSNCIVGSDGSLLSVGNTTTLNEGANVLTTKYTTDGAQEWQLSFNTAGNFNDFGIAVTEDNNGNIIVVGMSDNNDTSNTDIIVLKYSSNGSLLWSANYNSVFSKRELATAV